MSASIIIPARYASSRLPGKPLIEVAGISMLERIYRIANSVKNSSRVIVATEDRRVLDHVESFGGEAVLTSEDCRNGTERVWETTLSLNLCTDIIVNLQGDALLTPPWVIEEMIEEISKDQSVDLVTPALEFSTNELEFFKEHKLLAPASGTTVVFDKNNNALYFSKNVIPFTRTQGHRPTYRHIGLYGYRRSSLEQYINLEPTPLEQTEGLEQLRALENGMTIRVVVVDYRGRSHGSIDAPEDVELIEKIIKKEGELF